MDNAVIEMKEMRLNHCRGVVTNSVVAQNRTGQRLAETSHEEAKTYMQTWQTTGVKMA